MKGRSKKSPRAIKFRGFSNAKNSWVYGHYCPHDGDHYIFVPSIRGKLKDKFIAVHKDSVGQFIGLIDQEDKEIYDGDFVFGEEGFIEPVYGVCKFAGMAFVFDGKTASNQVWNMTVTSDTFGNKKTLVPNKFYNIKVIGNRFQSPDLISFTK